MLRRFRWRLDGPPNVNSTGRLVFKTVNSLFQRWPNTRMQDGESEQLRTGFGCNQKADENVEV